MSRQYAEPIIVQSLETSEQGAAPRRFLWRRRRYRVLRILQNWVEVGSWWRSASVTDEEYEMWRVEAAQERPPGSDSGQYDLCRHRGDGRWFLVRAFD